MHQSQIEFLFLLLLLRGLFEVFSCGGCCTFGLFRLLWLLGLWLLLSFLSCFFLCFIRFLPAFISLGHLLRCLRLSVLFLFFISLGVIFLLFGLSEILLRRCHMV